MNTGTGYLRLPLSFDTAPAMAEVNALPDAAWVDHFNPHDHEGRWKCLALRSVEGHAGHIIPFDSQDYRDTPALRALPGIRAILARFTCVKASVRLMWLAAGATIKPHRDPGTRLNDGVVRLHVPLQTHPDTLFVVEDTPVHFSQGGTWYLDATCRHAVYNRSPEPRIHLLIDCLPDAWLRQLLAQGGLIPRAPYGDTGVNEHNVVAVIDSLRQQATPTALALASQLETRQRAERPR